VIVDSVRLYFRYAAVSIRSQMQYRASFIMLTLSNFLITAIDILGIWALFERFKSLRGWSLAEIALLYGIVHMAHAVAEGAGRGFDTFDGMVKSGDFDRLLLRPRSTTLQISGAEVQLLRVGRFAQGLIILLWAASALDVRWSAGRVAMLCFATLGGACLFYGLFIVRATLAFWTTEALEVMNTVTDGGRETGQYPLVVYRPWFRRFFTFVVPLACVTYFPVLAILGRDDAALGSPLWFRWAAPAIGILFMAAMLQVWKIGVRHYRSTGS
jgi:ABC-2 type transport system permease protein